MIFIYTHPFYIAVKMGSLRVVLATVGEFSPADFPDVTICEGHFSRHEADRMIGSYTYLEGPPHVFMCLSHRYNSSSKILRVTGRSSGRVWLTR